jgi:hypothetical protein
MSTSKLCEFWVVIGHKNRIYMTSMNTKQAIGLFLIASDAHARGGPGSGKLSLGVIAVLAFSGTVYFIHRKFPNFFPGVAGLLIWLLIGCGITATLEYFGWVPREYFGIATVVVTFALIAILFLSG